MVVHQHEHTLVEKLEESYHVIVMRHYLSICNNVKRASEAKDLNLLSWVCYQNWYQYENEPPKNHYWVE